MDFVSINNAICKIESDLEYIKEQIKIYESQNKNKSDLANKKNSIYQAARMKEIYDLISTGLNMWQVAEKMKDSFGSVWDAYYFITHFLNEEKARKRYAKHFLVCALSNCGFSKVKISKVSGYTPQRCGQIIKSSHF